jgi:hypothetical protein
MLKWTSCLFATVALHAFHAGDVVFHHLFLVLTVTSLLYHTGHSTAWIRRLDVGVAYGTIAVSLVRAPCWWCELFPLAVIGLWVSQHYVPPKKADELHCKLHLVAVAGAHIFLIR